MSGSGSSQCAAQGGNGATCSADVQCRAGSICQTSLSQCANAGPLPDGGACSEKQLCAAGLTCVGATAGSLGACAPPRAQGAPCVAGLDCQAHLACVRVDGGSRQCEPRLADGAPCAAPRDCRLYSRCINGSCLALPRPGEACPFGACLYGVCEAGQPDAGPRCLPPLSPGGACLRDADCASGRCFSNRCLALCAP